MEVIAQQVRQFSPVLYIACAIGFITFAFVGMASLRDYRKAVFRMERSSMGARVSGAWLRAVLCAVAGIAIYFVANLSASSADTARRSITATIVPTSTVTGLILPTSLPTADYSDPAPIITPTFVIGGATDVPLATTAAASGDTLVSDVLATSAPTNTSVAVPTDIPPVVTVATNATSAAQSTAIQTVVAQNAPAVAVAAFTPAPSALPVVKTPTRLPAPTTVAGAATVRPLIPPTLTPIVAPLPAIPTAALVAAGSELPPADCVDPGTVGISNPGQGATVNGQSTVTGNVGFPADGSYAKLEVMPQEGGGWRFLSKLDVGVREGKLGGIDSSYLPPGAYFLRLLIVDKDGHEIKICRVSIRVQ